MLATTWTGLWSPQGCEHRLTFPLPGLLSGTAMLLQRAAVLVSPHILRLLSSLEFIFRLLKQLLLGPGIILVARSTGQCCPPRPLRLISNSSIFTRCVLLSFQSLLFLPSILYSLSSTGPPPSPNAGAPWGSTLGLGSSCHPSEMTLPGLQLHNHLPGPLNLPPAPSLRLEYPTGPVSSPAPIILILLALVTEMSDIYTFLFPFHPIYPLSCLHPLWLH